MDAISALRMEAQWAHEEFDLTTADVDAEVAHRTPQGQAGNVGSSMAHAIYSEDSLVNGMLGNKAPLAASTFAGKTGISELSMSNAPEWVRSVRIDLPLFREYAKAVAAATDQYIASLKESDLDRMIDLTQWGLGMRPVAWVLGALSIGHLHDLTGEISAIKGTHGLKGYPF